ncbi:hypothetical protein ANN_13818 [Periplaneta americana]|uniref:Uncharacterized protein n=1 Tax=Periplaneta americana TaxID=6978 RepID=A0ABQ8SUK5_PERAM|nr:hypothetical protein ANN_13818 [Periplaneta americana]
MCNMILSANIPLKKLSDPHFRGFLQKFSRYKNCLSDRRRRFSFDNLREYIVVYCNAGNCTTDDENYNFPSEPQISWLSDSVVTYREIKLGMQISLIPWTLTQTLTTSFGAKHIEVLLIDDRWHHMIENIYACRGKEISETDPIQPLTRFRLSYPTSNTVPSVYIESRIKVVVNTNSIELVSIVRSRNMFAFSSDERAFNIESYFRTGRTEVKIEFTVRKKIKPYFYRVSKTYVYLICCLPYKIRHVGEMTLYCASINYERITTDRISLEDATLDRVQASDLTPMQHPEYSHEA